MRCAARIGLSTLFLVTATGLAVAQSAGNLLVTVNEFTGSTSAPKYIDEYSAGGGFVQRLVTLSPTSAGGETVRDIVIGADGGQYYYYGTFTPTLTGRDPGTGTSTQQSLTGWSTANNVTYGGLAADRQYVYATDMATAGAGAPLGIVRFDTQGGAPSRFATDFSTIDVTMGRDGFLYALDGNSHVRKYNPATLAQIGTQLTLPFNSNGYRAIAVDTDGTIVAGQFDNKVDRISAAGVVLNTLTVPGVYGFSDVDINPLTGQIALASSFNSLIVITDAGLTTAVTQQVSASGSGDTFLAWNVAPVPEPTLTFMAGATIMLAFASGFWRRQGFDALMKSIESAK